MFFAIRLHLWTHPPVCGVPTVVLAAVGFPVIGVMPMLVGGFFWESGRLIMIGGGSTVSFACTTP